MTYSVFSETLFERWNMLQRAKHRDRGNYETRLAPLIEQCKINETLLGDFVLTCHVITTFDNIVEEAKYILCTNNEVRELAKWVNKNLVLTCFTDKIKTRDVKIRIAVDMLNKLENRKIISKDVALFYFDNICFNIRELWWDTMSDELPF